MTHMFLKKWAQQTNCREAGHCEILWGSGGRVLTHNGRVSQDTLICWIVLMKFYTEAVCVSSSFSCNHFLAYYSKTQSHNPRVAAPRLSGGNETNKGLAPQEDHSIATENGGTMNPLYIFTGSSMLYKKYIYYKQTVGMAAKASEEFMVVTALGSTSDKTKGKNYKKRLLKTLRSIWWMILQYTAILSYHCTMVGK